MISARRVTWLAVVGVLVAVIAFVAMRVWPRFAYAREQAAASDVIAQLPSRRPQNVDAEVWEVATTWTITAYENVCFSEEHVPIDSLRRFRVDVQQRLAGDVDFATIDWLWQRLAEIGPHGRQYRNRFEPRYRENLDAALGAR